MEKSCPCNAIYILDTSRDSSIVNMFCLTNVCNLIVGWQAPKFIVTVGLSANLLSNIQTLIYPTSLSLILSC